MRFKEPSQSKVCQLKNAVFIYKQIGSFYISMYYVIFMKEINAFENLIENALDLGNVEHIVSPNVPQIIVNKLHYHKCGRMIVLIFGSSGGIELIDPYHILVSQRLKQFNLSYRSIRKSLLSISYSRDLFNCIEFTWIFFLVNFVDLSICPLAYNRYRDIFLFIVSKV